MKNLPIWFIRLESLAIAVLAVVFFVRLDFDWWWLVILFIVFDISTIGYLANKRVGAKTYNIVHSYIGPALLLLNFMLTSTQWCAFVGLLWAFHIAVDRALGYGLKYATGFKDTHLGKIGKKQR